MKTLKYFKNAVFFLLLSQFFAGCDKQPSNVIDETVLFCLVNVENIDQTIPVVDKFLGGLSNDLNDKFSTDYRLYLNLSPRLTADAPKWYSALIVRKLPVESLIELRITKLNL